MIRWRYFAAAVLASLVLFWIYLGLYHGRTRPPNHRAARLAQAVRLYPDAARRHDLGLDVSFLGRQVAAGHLRVVAPRSRFD